MSATFSLREVSSGLISTTAAPDSFAIRGMSQAGETGAEAPITTRTPQVRASSSACTWASHGIGSPNRTTLGLRISPQAHRGTSPGDHRSRVGYLFQQYTHISSSRFPWYSITRREPAAWWRPSTFWVMTARTTPVFSRAANPWCAALGAARPQTETISESISHTLRGDCMKAWRVAYSIGSNFAHIPWAPRNDGMPLSTEIPAPVKATAFRRSARRRGAPPARGAPAPPAGGGEGGG